MFTSTEYACTKQMKNYTNFHNTNGKLQSTVKFINITNEKEQVLKLLTCHRNYNCKRSSVYFSRDSLSAHCYFFLYSNGAEMVTFDDYFTNENVGDFASALNTNKFWTGNIS